MVHKLRCLVPKEPHSVRRVASTIAVVVFSVLGATNVLQGQGPGVHYQHHGVMPPGAIGTGQLQRGGPLRGYFQPVEIKAPPGALVSLATAGTFDEPQPAGSRVGLLIGQVYRLRVTSIPMQPGREVFPTIEVIDRLYTPQGQQHRFAIPIQLTRTDLELALGGNFVTRVIYLENPRNASPVREDPQAQNWFEAGPKQDPLAIADVLGRPVAILRLGGRLPNTGEGPDDAFLFGCPPFTQLPARTTSLPDKPAPEKVQP